MSLTGKGENLNPLFPGQLCPEGKRRAKLLPPKSRRAKSEGLRDVPAADKGFRAGEGARSWLRGCWPGCHGFCANQPLACREAEGKGRILSVEELPPYLSRVLPPSAQWMCQSKGPKLAGTGYFGKLCSWLWLGPGRALLQGCPGHATFGVWVMGRGNLQEWTAGAGFGGACVSCGTPPEPR